MAYFYRKFGLKYCRYCGMEYYYQDDICPNCFRETRKVTSNKLQKRESQDVKDWIRLYDSELEIE